MLSSFLLTTAIAALGVIFFVRWSTQNYVAKLKAAHQAEIEKLRAQLDTPHARGEVRGIDAMNNALWRMGALKHRPPSFKYFDPQLEEQRAVAMKEVKLPRAEQTHEVCYEPTTRCLFVSQMSNSVLVRIPVGADGLLVDDQDAWNVGPAHPKTGIGVGGLHNVSRSSHNPGCLWLTLQFSNELILLDAATMGVRQVIKCPQILTRPDGTVLRIGGPHCLCECGQSGHIWVALKGSVPCHPGVTGSTKASLASAITRVCCNPEAIKERMEAARAAEGGGKAAPLEVLPEGYAVWRLDPKKYAPKETGAFGGALYECEPSPPMMAIDKDCNCWVVQDRAPSVMRIDAKTGATEQFRVPLPQDSLQMSGPAVATAPDGGIWATLFGDDGGLVRFGPDGKRSYLKIGKCGAWLRTSRFIHMRFVALPKWWNIWKVDGVGPSRVNWPVFNALFLISSNLLDDEAMNMITCIAFNPYVGSGWEAPMMRKDIPLPTQDCCCHRIEIIADSEDDARVSAVVSELSSSRLFQTKLFNLEIYDFLLESKDTARTACGRDYTVYEYRKLGGANSKEKPPDSFLKMVGMMNKFCAVFPPNPDIIMPDPADPSGEKLCRTAEEKEAYKGLVESFESVNPNRG